MAPLQEIFRHGLGHALGEIILIVLVSALFIVLGLPSAAKRSLEWINRRVWARAATAILIVIVLAVIFVVAVDLPLPVFSFFRGVFAWLLEGVPVPRCLLWPVVALAVLKCCDPLMLLWRRRTRSRRGPYTDTVFPKPGGASSFETLTADDFFQKIAGVWRHRFGERGVEYLRIDHNGNYYLERNDIEVRVFTLGNLFFNRVTHEISFDKINTGEDDPENRRKGTCLVNEVIALDSTGSTMSGHGGHDRHTVSYERLSEEPNEAAKAFFQKVAGKWHLDWGRGQEDLRIDVFGNYFLIPVGKKEVRYFTLENVVFAAKDQHVGFDKVDTGEFDSKARPKGRRLARDEVDIASDVLSMHGVDDKGRRLKYTRTRPGCSAKLL